MIINYKLKSVSEIFSGYSFRTSVTDLPLGNIFVLQSGNICDDMSLDLQEEFKLDVGDIQTKAFANRDDILIGSKGNPTIGFVESDDQILVSSSMYIIRVKEDTILPKYLAIFLHSMRGQREINKITLGGYIKGISKKHLEKLVVPVPPMDIQEKVVFLYDNIINQNRFLKRKSKINNEILDYVVNHLSY
jgi:type I restriction enzyme S subunit